MSSRNQTLTGPLLSEAVHEAFNEARSTARATADMSLSGHALRAAFKADDEAVTRFVELLRQVPRAEIVPKR